MKNSLTIMMGTAVLLFAAGCASDDHPGQVTTHEHNVIHQYPFYDHNNPQHRMRANSGNAAFSPSAGGPAATGGPGAAASGAAGVNAGANVGVGSATVGGAVGGNANIGVKTP